MAILTPHLKYLFCVHIWQNDESINPLANVGDFEEYLESHKIAAQLGYKVMICRKCGKTKYAKPWEPEDVNYIDC